MSSRLLAVAVAALLTTTFAAAPAGADQAVGLGQAVAGDGVVTSWTASAPSARSVQLRSLQELGGGGSVTTATSEVAAIGPTARAVAARLPIGAGGTLELVGGPATVTATVEPDRDGDGYGDTTQDACPSDFADHQAPCTGAATLGLPLTLAPDPRGFSGSGSPLQALTHLDPLAPRPSPTPYPWVLTRWRLRADPAGGDTVLQLVRRDGGGTFTVEAETAPIHVTGTDVVGVPAQVPFDGAASLAARSVASGNQRDLGVVARVAGEDLDTNQPPATLRETFTPNGSASNLRLLVQADIEPDKDRDGKGDVTQDRADLVVTGSGPASVGATASFTHSYTVRNAGPDAALSVELTLKRAGVLEPTLPAGSTCVAVDAGTRTCTVPRLDAGATLTVVPDVAAAGSLSFGGRTETSSLSADALTLDPDPTNNAASLATAVAAYAPNLPAPPAFRLVACGNLIRGTRDDDVLRGTVFGDRLVGNDGDDLLKGASGDDCLEGGVGDDVLDGGTGNDRLAGASGKDRLLGGNGDDRLTGGKGNDRLSGGPGSDTLSPGAGRDAVDGGAGNDTINAVDGVRETIECGAGRDTVRADRRDRLKHCEKVTRRP